MRKYLKMIVPAALVAAGLAASTVLAHGDDQSMSSSDRMMGSGMMGNGNMMGMMPMMGQMAQMMETCTEMMQSMMTGHGAQPSGEQWMERPGPGKQRIGG